MKNLEEMIRQLPPELRGEVEDFVRKLMKSRRPVKKRKPTFAWAGALSDMKEDYSSVDLQYKISKERI